MADFEESIEEMVGTTREAAGGDRVRRGRDWGRDRWSRDETSDKTAVTADDERDGGDRWGLYMDCAALGGLDNLPS